MGMFTELTLKAVPSLLLLQTVLQSVTLRLHYFTVQMKLLPKVPEVALLGQG